MGNQNEFLIICNRLGRPDIFELNSENPIFTLSKKRPYILPFSKYLHKSRIYFSELIWITENWIT